MVNTEHNAGEVAESKVSQQQGENITIGEKKCMHCGQTGEYPFCVGGGKLRMGGVSRSYCFQSFKVLALQGQRMNHELSKEQTFVLANPELFTDWIKGLPKVVVEGS